ncbi:glycosyltransferase [Pontibacter cellulosilyticus]|uniref:Glycosyltransferase n=1 Tax=Pontibacter cellulosilyticus TaxID=1720253 RepID=A0A923N7H9_9BACT|nr:glycosyltransferase [Pontibacter cellulosilyticus]MBC5992312.1 glycosyltransferase [Pontibacter cellulosilyticus]
MEQKINYWLLTTELPPQFGGGIGTYCKHWSQVLKLNGNNVTIFLPNRYVQSYAVEDRFGVRVIEFSPYFSDTSSYLGYETMISYSFAEIVKLFAEKEGVPDWIEAQEYNGIAYYLLQRKNLGESLYKDMKVVITCHAPSFLYFEYNHINTYKLPYFWIGEMEKYCIVAADVCISPSQYLVDCLHDRMQIDRDIHVIHNPFFASEPNECIVQENKVVFLAKLSPSKGILETLRYFKNIWQSGLKYKLQLIGDNNFYYHAKKCTMGEYIEENYADYLSKGLLEIKGLLSPDEVKEEISSAKVVIVPSTVDNLPYTVLECMSSKKIILASNQGGHKELIVDELNGFLFDHDDYDSFLNKLRTIFNLDELRIKEIGDNAAVTVANKCDPQAYYEDKLGIIENHTQKISDETNYKFTREIGAVAPKREVDFQEEQSLLLSVVVPFYNMGKFINETVESILSSKHKEIEIIIVDDGSDDQQSLSVLKSLSSKENIIVSSQVNSGLAEARNTGARLAKGRFLAFLDADDVVDPEYYARAISILTRKANVHFVGSWVQYFDGANGIWPSFNPEPPYLLYHNMINSSGLVYNRTSFLIAGLNDKKFIYGMEDYDSVISMVKQGFRGVVIPEVLFMYRVRKDSMARGFNHENQRYLYQLLADKHREFYSIYAVEITNLLNANGPGYIVNNPTIDYQLYSGSFYKIKLIRKLFTFIKQQPYLRKKAIHIYNKFKA